MLRDSEDLYTLPDAMRQSVMRAVHTRVHQDTAMRTLSAGSDVPMEPPCEEPSSVSTQPFPADSELYE